MEDWLDKIRKAKKTAFIKDGLRKVHFQIDPKTEMVEEYDETTKLLQRRAFRRRQELKGRSDWEMEIGTADPQPENSLEISGIKESTTQPFVSRLNTKNNLEWRIRNLPYPIEVYSVTIDPGQKNITVRTSNKKYFKYIQIPDFERLNIIPDAKEINFTHKYNTLIITLKKPKEFINFENAMWEEVKRVPAKKEDNMECRPS